MFLRKEACAGLWTGQPGASRLLAAALLCTALAGCGSSSSHDAAASTSSAASKYGYGKDAFTSCLTDNGVQYRDDAQGQMTVVNMNDPAVAKKANDCETMTTKPSTASNTARLNAITKGIADCLTGRGYHVSTKNGDLSDGSGRGLTTFTVAAAERDSAKYQQDVTDCQTVAEAANPSASK